MMMNSSGLGATPPRLLRLWALIAILALLLNGHVEVVVQAFPTGAGSCLAGPGAALVGTSHVDFGPTSLSSRHGGNYSLDISNVTLMFGNTTMARPDATVLLPIGQDMTWTLTAGRVPIRGYLVRFEAPNGTDTTAAISCGVDDQPFAAACVAPIVGCTHSDNKDKFTVTGGTVRFDEITKGVLVDVTVVFQNNYEKTERDDTVVSFFASGRFVVDFESADSSGGFARFFSVLRELLSFLTTALGGGGGGGAGDAATRYG